jgi:pSer/pThr/pTyr-binding forkhead associated (FHA) protein
MSDEQQPTSIEESQVENVESPQTDGDGEFAEIVLLREGTPTDISYLITNRAVIGRFDPSFGPIDIDLGTLQEGVYVSRKHAMIYQHQGQWFIEDLGSSNGTFILPPGEDFIRIDSPTSISDKQEIAFGNVRFRFDIKSKQDPTGLEESPQPEALHEIEIEELEP